MGRIRDALKGATTKTYGGEDPRSPGEQDTGRHFGRGADKRAKPTRSPMGRPRWA